MKGFKRSDENPVLMPNADECWEGTATFNGCPVKFGSKTMLLYRAESVTEEIEGQQREFSTIGCASSKDGIHFKDRHQLIRPEFDWEKHGCEDPRVTKFGSKYYIFYTALSAYPFRPEGIKVGLAITRDFGRLEEKHPVTTFNSKAMALFPEKIKGRMAAVLSVNTDNPPARIAVAYFDREEQIWEPDYWEDWKNNIDSHTIPLQRSAVDHLEVGAPPIKTEYGWLIIYSYIQNYFSSPRIFGVEAALLNPNNPSEVIARTKGPLLIAEAEYEKCGRVPNVVFPSGALVRGQNLDLYYGGADLNVNLATLPLKDLIEDILELDSRAIKLERYPANPILSPEPRHAWEAKATFNPAAIYEKGKVHLVYRAMSNDDTSVFGYAASDDGFRITERLAEPVYVPRKKFEMKLTGGNSGCEDPRLTCMGDEVFMLYTAYNGQDPPRVALTSIKMDDFLNKRWNWADPVLISPPGVADKDAALFPKKINGKYAILHRLGDSIWLDFTDDLKFDGNRVIRGTVIMTPLQVPGGTKKIGIAGPPIETPYGWLLIFHGITIKKSTYVLKAALLDLDDPILVTGRTYTNILEPEIECEKCGLVNDVVFSCGAVVIDDKLFLYYGGADKVIGVATTELSQLVQKLRA